ncbi:MAG: RNA polymerase sigma factor [Candidatus Zixiibacteriota bacterium]
MDSGSDRFWRLLEPEHPKAEAFCRRLAGNRDEGSDLYQDGLLTALRRFGTLRDESSFRPWLYRILVNTYQNRCRSNRKFQSAELTDDVTGHNPADAYAAKRTVARALAALKPMRRTLVVLYELEGWSVHELAAMYGRSEGTVKSWLSRSRRKMVAALTAVETPNLKTHSESKAPYAVPQPQKPLP